MANPIAENTTLKRSLYQRLLDAIGVYLVPSDIATLSEVRIYLDI